MRWKLDWDCATNELSRSSRLEISSRLFMRRWFELGWGRLQPFRLCRACLLEGSAFENTCDRPSVSLPRTTAIPDASIRVVHRRVSQPLILSVCCSRNATHTPRHPPSRYLCLHRPTTVPDGSIFSDRVWPSNRVAVC